VTPTSLTSYCQSYTYFSTDYSATVCGGMDWNLGNDLGYKWYTTFDVTSCMAYCYETYSSAVGGFMMYSTTGSHTCCCKATPTGSFTQQSCWYGVGFYKGEGSSTGPSVA
jgi:hypothetical protein